MAFREFEIELDSRHFQVLARIDVHDGSVTTIHLEDVSEWPEDGDESIRISPIPMRLGVDLCMNIERQINDPETLRDLESEDIEAARDKAIDDQISRRKEER